MTDQKTICPVCAGEQSETLLTLKKFPVYQHPVPVGATLQPPFEVDIEYGLCRDCGQAYQRHYDKSVLENLYKQHYYTPRPGHIGTKFTQDFVGFFKECVVGQEQRFQSVLEIGCSAAEVLSEIRTLYPQMEYLGIEPNDETREQAEGQGFCVYNSFFNRSFAEALGRKVDIIYSRHVIEHVFDFDDYIAAASMLLNPDGAMFIETPGLDWAIEHESRAPFHVEHVSLFCKHSLQVLLARHGWFIQKYQVSDVGNLIAFCTRDREQALSFSVPENIGHFQQGIDAQKQRLAEQISGRKIAMWGAGAGGRALMSFLDFVPDVILDGNPNKSERIFAGYEQCRIQSAEEWIAQNKDDASQWIMVVASSFYDEIAQSLQAYGWHGDATYPYRY